MEGEGTASNLGVHGTLAHKIAREVLADPSSACARFLSKVGFACMLPANAVLPAPERSLMLPLPPTFLGRP